MDFKQKHYLFTDKSNSAEMSMKVLFYLTFFHLNVILIACLFSAIGIRIYTTSLLFTSDSQLIYIPVRGCINDTFY